MNPETETNPNPHEDSSDLIVVRDEIDGVSILHIFADVDTQNAVGLAEEIEAFSRSEPLIVDLSKCNFIDGACLERLAEAYACRADGIRIVVVPGSRIERIFRIVRPLCELPLATSASEALRQFREWKQTGEQALSAAASS